MMHLDRPRRDVRALAALLLMACATTAAIASPRGSLKTVEVLQHFTREAIDEANRQRARSGDAKCNVRIVQLTYQSTGVKGEPEVLSAGLYVPEDCAGPFPLLAQGHGTEARRDRLSTQVGASNTVVSFFAARGYVVVAPDYLGLGKSDFPYHPYLHADSEAAAIVDAIRAAQAAVEQLRIPVTGQVMLVGYSQGGHAAMAAQREIERHYKNEINLVAAAPIAGPYYLSQTFQSSWFGYTGGETNVFASELLAYTLVSYNRIYRTLYKGPTQLFSEPYASRVEQLFSGSLDLSDINERKLLPPGNRLNDLRNPAFTASFMLDERHPLRVALKKNDLLDFTPRAPMLLCGSRRDAIVDFQNAYAAQAAFRTRGADVPVVDIADEIPSSASGAAHHLGYSYLCYAKVRELLFDPIVQAEKTLRAMKRD